MNKNHYFFSKGKKKKEFLTNKYNNNYNIHIIITFLYRQLSKNILRSKHCYQ